MASSNVPETSPAMLNEEPAAARRKPALVRSAGETDPASGPVIANPEMPVWSKLVSPKIGLVQPL